MKVILVFNIILVLFFITLLLIYINRESKGSPEEQVDKQLRSAFKPKHEKVKICTYCGKLLTAHPYGYWVDGNGKTTYNCIECSRIIQLKREVVQDKYCKEKYGCNLSQNGCCCIECCYNSECGKLQQEAENKTAEELRGV